jgi:hypothetical protein
MFADLSPEINHIDSHISFEKNWFSRFTSEITLLSEFKLCDAQNVHDVQVLVHVAENHATSSPF